MKTITNFTVPERRWLDAKIEQGLHDTIVTVQPLIEASREGDERRPSEESITVSVRNSLTREQIQFLMDPANPKVVFHLRPITSFGRLSEMIDNYTVFENQTPTGISPRIIDSFMEKDMCEDRIVRWEWEFVWGDQILRNNFVRDNELILHRRRDQFTSILPEGMGGVDRYTWGMLMADSMRRGRPLDLSLFEGEALSTNITLLDEEEVQEVLMVACDGDSFAFPIYDTGDQSICDRMGCTAKRHAFPMLAAGFFCTRKVCPDIKPLDLDADLSDFMHEFSFRATVRGKVVE